MGDDEEEEEERGPTELIHGDRWRKSFDKEQKGRKIAQKNGEAFAERSQRWKWR